MKILKNLCLSKDQVTLKTLSPNDKPRLIECADNQKIWDNNPHINSFAQFEIWYTKTMQQMQQETRWPFSVAWNDTILGSMLNVN